MTVQGSSPPNMPRGEPCYSRPSPCKLTASLSSLEVRSLLSIGKGRELRVSTAHTLTLFRSTEAVSAMAEVIVMACSEPALSVADSSHPPWNQKRSLPPRCLLPPNPMFLCDDLLCGCSKAQPVRSRSSAESHAPTPTSPLSSSLFLSFSLLPQTSPSILRPSYLQSASPQPSPSSTTLINSRIRPLSPFPPPTATSLIAHCAPTGYPLRHRNGPQSRSWSCPSRSWHRQR